MSVFVIILKLGWIRRTDSRTFKTTLFLQWPTSIIFFVAVVLLSRQVFSTNKLDSHNHFFQCFLVPPSSLVILTIYPTSRTMSRNSMNSKPFIWIWWFISWLTGAFCLKCSAKDNEIIKKKLLKKKYCIL